MRVWRASDSVKPGKFGSRGLATHDDAGRRSRGFRIVTTAGVAATLVSLGWVAFVFAAPVFQTGPGLTVEPSEVYTGDSIKITLDGLPPGHLIPGGSVMLSGARLAIPGIFGAAGVQPITDAAGQVSFTTKVPLEAPYGPGELVASNLGFGGSRATPVNVLAAKIEFSPTSASPNETVTLRRLAFSPSTSPGGNGPLGVHQITGQGKSGIKINGKLLEAPYVRYPIDLDSDGGLTTKILLPESYVTALGVGLQLKS